MLELLSTSRCLDRCETQPEIPAYRKASRASERLCPEVSIFEMRESIGQRILRTWVVTRGLGDGTMRYLCEESSVGRNSIEQSRKIMRKQVGLGFES